MTVQQIFDKVRFITKLDTNDASDTQLYRLLNDAVSDQLKFVASLRDDFLLKQGTSANLVNGTRDYTLATDVLQLKKVMLSYDGTNYYVAYEKDLNLAVDLNTVVESQTAPTYTKITQTTATEFIIRIEPTPTANATNGLMYWYIARPAALSSSSETPVTPPELHPSLVQMLVRDLKQRDGDYSGMSQAEGMAMKMQNEYKSGVSQRNIDTYEGFVANSFTE